MILSTMFGSCVCVAILWSLLIMLITGERAFSMISCGILSPLCTLYSILLSFHNPVVVLSR